MITSVKTIEFDSELLNYLGTDIKGRISIDAFKDIRCVDTDSFKSSMYKYMPFSRVIDMLKNGIPFIYPEKWYDPYETKFLTTNFSSSGYVQPKVYGLCARMDIEADDASWKAYSDKGEPIIRVRINTPALLLLVSNFCKENNCVCYFSKISYLSTNEINGLSKPGNERFDEYCNNMDESKYIRLLSLKRIAYKYENERRLFIVPKDGTKSLETKGDIIKIGWEYCTHFGKDTIFSNFTVQPKEKAFENDIISGLKNSTYDGQLKFIKSEIKKYIPDARVSTSTLYKRVKPVKEI